MRKEISERMTLVPLFEKFDFYANPTSTRVERSIEDSSIKMD
jgi:hypothetical protein